MNRRPLAAVAALALAGSVLVAAPATAHHCVYSGGAFICGPGGDPSDPWHLNDPDPGRIAGADRYATAAAISSAFWEPGQATVVYIANGWTVDATAAGASVNGPILLVDYGETVPSVTLAEITRLAPVQVVAIGGTASVSDAQLNAAAAAGQ